MLRTLLVLVALAGTAPSGETFAHAYEAGWSIAYEGEGTQRLALGDVTVMVNDQELPPEALGEMGDLFAMDESEEISLSVTTKVVEVADGRPTVVEHTLERLARTKETAGETEETTGPLEGERVRVSLGEDGERVTELLGEDGEPTEELEEDLQLVPELDSILPTEEVSEGDSWEPAESFLDPESDEALGWFPVDLGEGDGEDDEENDEMFAEALQGAEVQVTWTETREEGDERVAVLVVGFELRIDFLELMGDEFDLEDLPEGSTATSDGTLRFDYVLHWSLTRGRPHAMRGGIEFEAELSMDMPIQEGVDMTMDIEFQGEFVREASWTYEG